MDHTCKELHLDITINENEIIPGAKEIIKSIRPTWPLDQLLFKTFTDGITNKLIGVWYPDHYNEMVLVRVYGHKTDLLIDRKHETRNIRILHKAGYTHSIYATFNNGLAYEFVEGETLSTETIRNSEVFTLIAKRMAQMHKLQPDHPDISKEPVIWEKTEKFMRLMPKSFNCLKKQKRFEELIQPYRILEEEYCHLKEQLSVLNNPVVFAHNDLLLGNVLYNKNESTVTFIDYEYAGYNYQAFDIANHFAEFAGLDNPDYSLYPDEHLQKRWMRIYLQEYHNTEDIDEALVNKLYEHVNKFILLAHFFWGCWALIQSQHSHIDFDFLEYAAVRFTEFFKIKDHGFKCGVQHSE